jgi:mannose-6-phosphate isomerase-like protein (cupin superfamily)
MGEILFHEPANENDPPPFAANYWQELATRQEEAGLAIKLKKVIPAIKEHGGGSKAVCVFDNWETDQIHSPHMYLGYASRDSNNKESVHVHLLQTEFYIVLKGTAEIWTKRYWKNSKEWKRHVLNQGDIYIVWPQTCHFFQVRSPQGITAVTKAINTLGGVGRPPAGKLTCAKCPRFNNGCDGLKAA